MTVLRSVQELREHAEVRKLLTCGIAQIAQEKTEQLSVRRTGIAYTNCMA
jgi:hypothetical protein